MDARVTFWQPGGLCDQLLENNKKGIVDGSCTGDGHNSAGVHKFKGRALKRHKKFNSMLKTFKCLGATFRHTALKAARHKCCFCAMSVLATCG